MIEAIKIIYDQSNIKEMYFWSELLNLAGIFTYEITQKQVRSFKNRNSLDYSAILILTTNMNQEDIKYLQKIYPEAILIDGEIIKNIKSLNIKTEEEKELWKKYLNKWMNVLKEKLFDDVVAEASINALKNIGNIYIKYNIAFHRISSINFTDYQELGIQKTAQDYFVKAYVDLINQKQEGYIYLYTLASLGRYMNDTCVLLNHNQLITDEKIMNFLNSVLKQEPGYISAYLLKAITSENSRSHLQQREAIGYYYMMERMLEGREYAYKPLYYYARHLKKQEQNEESAFEYYDKAQRLNLTEYKSLCYIGKYFMKKKKYGQAEVILEEAKKIILSKEKYMLPLDYEYYKAIYLGLEFLYGSAESFCNLDKYENLDKEKEKLQKNCSYNKGCNEIFGKEEKKKILERIRYL